MEPIPSRLSTHILPPWTISTLDSRFRRLFGRSQMRYLGEWRLRLAANLLRGLSLGIVTVAYRVSYDSEAAFNRAFKRAMGHPRAGATNRR